MRNFTITALGPRITVREGKPPVRDSVHGALDERTLSIIIDPDQSEAAKHSVLLHEFLHLCDIALMASGVIKRRTSHPYITSLAPNLLMLLVEAGLYRGISKRAVREFYASLSKPPTKRKAKP